MKYSEIVKSRIVSQGRKKNWLAEQLNISRPTLDSRLIDNAWTNSELNKLVELNMI